jgi:hypothetical protein
VHIHLVHGLGSSRLGKGRRGTVEGEGIADTVLAKDLGEVVDRGLGPGMLTLRGVVVQVEMVQFVMAAIVRVVINRGPRLSFAADSRRWSVVTLYCNCVIGNIPNQGSVSLSLLDTRNCDHNNKQEKYVLRTVMGERYSGVIPDQVGCNEDYNLFVLCLLYRCQTVVRLQLKLYRSCVEQLVCRDPRTSTSPPYAER